MCVVLMGGAWAAAQDVAVTGQVELLDASIGATASSASGAVVWLTPVTGTPAAAATTAPPPAHGLRLVQHNKSFEPHVLVVPVGSVVEFPNRDPFFHNVFSLFEGKRFDLGLYEAGSTRNVHFDRPGISYIFCNIHPEMSAVVIALETPYYAVSDRRGEILIPGVPPDRYLFRVWHQSSLPEALNGLSHEITVSQTGSSLGVIRLTQTTLPRTHKNKYGRDYDRVAPPSPVYENP